MAIKLFYSYSHIDESYRQRLETHLAILRRSGIISEWHDRRISPGANWEEDINENLDKADIILLLVSSNFLASDYCYDTETVRALEMNKNNEAKVIPIILESCLWKISHFAKEKLKALPKDGMPVTSYRNQDEAWLEIAEGIMLVANQLKEKKDRDVDTYNKEKVIGPKEYEKEKLIKEFLCSYAKWYFSPLRIVSWGGRQKGFEELEMMTSAEAGSILKKLNVNDIVTTKISQKGNTIYKIKKVHC